MGLERCLQGHRFQPATAANQPRTPAVQDRHTPIDVSEYLLGREKFCKDIQTGCRGTGITKPSCWYSKPDLGAKGDTQIIVSSVVEIDFVAEFEAESDGTYIGFKAPCRI